MKSMPIRNSLLTRVDRLRLTPSLFRPPIPRTFAAGVILLAALVLWFRPVAAQAVIIDGIAATVNQDIITISEVEEASLGQIQALKEQATGQQDQAQEIHAIEQHTLDKLIEQKLEIQEARQMKITVSNQEVESALQDVKQRNGLTDEALRQYLDQIGLTLPEYKNKLRDQIMIRRLTNFEVRSRVQVTEKEIEDYYRQHRNKFLSNVQVHLLHLLFYARPESDPQAFQKARQLAEEAYQEIQAGAKFSGLAKGFGARGVQVEEVDLGYVHKGELMPDLEKIAFALKSGEVSPPFRSQYGYHIVKVVDRKGGTPLPLEQVRGQISQEIFDRKAQQRYENWIAGLKAKAYIGRNMK